MKLQSLAIIFVLIILPITMVLSEYISNLMEARETEMSYDTKLLNSTYDAVKSYQLNTVNNALGNVTTQKVEDIEAAAQTFFNSLTSNFNFSGYNSNVMQEYVPALVFTMYDGYYIYSPFTNTLTEIGDNTNNTVSYDAKFSNPGEMRDGLKPYVYYNCRYIDTKNNHDFVITYTLDNYITIQGKVNGEYTYDCGYIYSKGGITKNEDGSYTYNGVRYSEDDTEELREYVGDTEYAYARINGKKYYLDTTYYGKGKDNEKSDDEIEAEMKLIRKTEVNDRYIYNEERLENILKNDNDFYTSGIFYIDSTGAKNYSQTKGFFSNNLVDENKEFIKYYLAIKKNKSAYEYFKHAYEFSEMVLGDGENTTHYLDKAGIEHEEQYKLGELKTENAIIYGEDNEYNKENVNNNLSQEITNIKEYGSFDIFAGSIERPSSNFEQHRKSVIRYIIETNLTTAIKGFSSLAKDVDFIMPKISEEDWDLIENDVCAVSFMQGMAIGTKQYNGYAVVANTLTTEKIGESDIYILAEDKNGKKIYCKPNDRKLLDKNEYNVLGMDNYYPGIWKLNFESKQDASIDDSDTIVYQPMSYANNEGGKNVREPYLGSYSSVMGTSDIEFIGGGHQYADMYSYMENIDNDINLKQAYYKGFARERWSNYNVNNINYEIYNNSNGCDYFLNDYDVKGPRR